MLVFLVDGSLKKNLYHLYRIEEQVRRYIEKDNFKIESSEETLEKILVFKENFTTNAPGFVEELRNILNYLKGIKTMSTTEITLTLISVLGMISSIAFAFLFFRRNSKSDTKEIGRESGTMISDLGYIKSSIERIEKRLDLTDSKFLS
ncbi:hypothetical protein JN09_001482 [Acholeplasma morum]|uniref:hypothetical protein n=1 Tax=Paracholeplasma morum TaxID=264637 RepID=UPI001958BC74|nr:hypothetical protein [Paracholeplasma morum]MBM7454130.1 hypothetical protein [Paracholeplasma morum]